MDEYLSEKEQIELIRQWWRDNGWYLIGGAVLAGLGYLGWGQYQAYLERQAEAASALYAQLRQTVDEDRPGAEDLLAELVGAYPGSPYTDQARLLMAREFLISDTDRSADELRTVMESSSDPGLAMVARLRLARVLAYQERFDEALTVLAVDSPGEFEAQIKVIEGDIHIGRGATDDARRAYTDALTHQSSALIDRSLVQMKLAELPLPGFDLFPGAAGDVDPDEPVAPAGESAGAAAPDAGSVAPGGQTEETPGSGTSAAEAVE